MTGSLMASSVVEMHNHAGLWQVECMTMSLLAAGKASTLSLYLPLMPETPGSRRQTFRYPALAEAAKCSRLDSVFQQSWLVDAQAGH